MSFKRLDNDLNVIKNITGSADNNYGLTEEQMKSKFDEASLKIQEYLNEHVNELENLDAAKSIGYNGALGGNSHTVAEALDKLEQSGIGNIPPSNTITTDKIVNKAVTQEKLSDKLNNRLDYLYSNLTKILIQNGAQGEIEGSEDLMLFGINGELEESYNLTEEKTSKWLDNYGTPTDNQTFVHTLVDAESTLNTNDIYNVTDEFTVHNTKLTEIKNAILSLTNNSLLVNNNNYETVEVFPTYIGDNYYAVATWGWEDYDDDKGQSKLFVVKYDENSKEFSIVHQTSLSREQNGDSYFQVVNGYAYWMTVRWLSDVDRCSAHRLSKEGIKSNTVFDDSYSYAGFADGTILYVDEVGSNTEKICRTEFGSGYRELFTSKKSYVYPLSGYWALIRLDTAYMLYNVSSGISKTITQEEYNKYYDKAIRSSMNLDTFYLNGYRYTIDDAGNITQHEFIENFVSGKYTYKISDSEELIYSGDKNSSVYKIVRRENENSICIEMFNTSSIVESVQAENPGANPDHFTFNPNGNILLFGIDFGRSTNALIRVTELTKGTIKLATPLTNTLNGIAKVSREHKCTIPAKQVKQIFIKPETEGNAYNAINIIVYLDRELTTGDELKVELLDAAGNKTELTMLDSSSATTKYYNHSYGMKTADIEAVVTIKAGATEIKATQILGGVDNAI